MASLVYTYAKQKIANGTIDLDTHDIRVALVGTSTTCDTEEDVALMNGFTTLDECDATDYARVALANEAVNVDTANDRGEFDADDAAFGAIGNGTNFTIQGAVIYKHVTDDTDSLPIAYIEFASTLTTNGGTVTINWNAEGIIQLT